MFLFSFSEAIQGMITTTDKEIEERIYGYLKDAKDRNGGRDKRRKK
jgi:hypothetical protein